MRQTSVSLLVMLSIAAMPAIADGWDHSGGTAGRFGNPQEACKDLIGKGTAYEFAKTASPESEQARADGYMQCYSKAKDDKKGVAIYIGLVYATPDPVLDEKAEAEKAAKEAEELAAQPGCGDATVMSWFPTAEDTPALATIGTGLAPDSKPGSCDLATTSAAGRLFTQSKQKARPDRVKKKSGNSAGEHYYLTWQGLIIDPTIFQFFVVKGGFKGHVFVGTEAQLKTTLAKLLEVCGPNPKTTEATTADALFLEEYAKPEPCNAGATLEVMKDGGNLAAYKKAPYCDKYDAAKP